MEQVKEKKSTVNFQIKLCFGENTTSQFSTNRDLIKVHSPANRSGRRAIRERRISAKTVSVWFGVVTNFLDGRFQRSVTQFCKAGTTSPAYTA